MTTMLERLERLDAALTKKRPGRPPTVASALKAQQKQAYYANVESGLRWLLVRYNAKAVKDKAVKVVTSHPVDGWPDNAPEILDAVRRAALSQITAHQLWQAAEQAKQD